MNKPDWIRIKDFDRARYAEFLRRIERSGLHTVCQSGNCPNRYECFSAGTATFMVMGDVCTRNCLYCNIDSGHPQALDPGEPERVADMVGQMGLDHAVITSVSRDDLSDGGAGHFAATVRAVRRTSPKCRIELLTSDLAGNKKSINVILNSRPDVLNHNLEIVRRLFPSLRPQGDYERSLEFFSYCRSQAPDLLLKSGLILGLGESRAELEEAFKDLAAAGVSILTLGQYLRPRDDLEEVHKYYSPAEFDELAETAKSLGLSHVTAGPMVRSSYRAGISLGLKI